MAASMIRALLERFTAQGGRVLSPEDRSHFPIEATFGLMGGPVLVADDVNEPAA